VLVGDAVMPNANELPPSLAEFTHRNAVKVDAGRDFNVHIDRLVKALSAIGLANPEAMPAVAVKEAAATGGKLTPAVLTAYVTVPLVLLLLAHYLFVIKLDLHTTYLRLAAIVIPLLLGLLLFGRDRRSHGVALLVATAVALGAVLGMHVVAAAIEGTSLIPAEPAEWQVAFEFFASIVLSAVAGYLAARMLHSAGWRRSR
jgi:hypothetical protein